MFPTKAVANGLDTHRMCASSMYETPIERVTPEQRSGSKACTFGVIYGMDKDVVTDTAKIELDAAQAVEAKRLAQIRLYAG